MTAPRLTPYQRRTLLVILERPPHHRAVRLISKGPHRETSSGAALVRKGLAARDSSGRFYPTAAGIAQYLRLIHLDLADKIPPRGTTAG